MSNDIIPLAGSNAVRPAVPGRSTVGPGLAEDPARAVDVGALGEDEHVVDGLAVGDDRRQVADDHRRPAVGRGGEGGLLLLRSARRGIAPRW